MPWPPEDPDMWAVEARFKGGKSMGLDYKEQHDKEWNNTNQGRDHPKLVEAGSTLISSEVITEKLEWGSVSESVPDTMAKVAQEPRVGEAEKTAAKSSLKVKKVPVVEIFGPTIQGEGAMIGVRTTFIRFGLCDYRCTMCDSLHAVLPELVKINATWMTSEEIVNELLPLHTKHSRSEWDLSCDWVTFSGGNPCIHDLTELIMRIRGLDVTHGKIKIAVETQGTLLPDWLSWCDVITVSPKGPGMGEEFEQAKFMQFLLRFKHHKGFNVKVVVFSAADLEFASHINGLMRDEGLEDKMYLSLGNPYPPGKDIVVDTDFRGTTRDKMDDDEIRLELMKSYSILSEELLQMPHMMNVKFLPQLHVLAWANKQKV